MATATVSTSAIKALAAKMADATEASVKTARDSVVSSAEHLRDAIGGSTLLAWFDPQGPERKQQQKNIDEAINKLKKSTDTESIKKNLFYLQATVDVTQAFYGGSNDAFSRAFGVFIDDIKNAPALLVTKVIAPIVTGAAEIGGKTFLAAIKGLWPIIALAIVVVIVIGVAKKRIGG